MDPRIVLPAYVMEGREVYAAGIESEGRPEVLFGFDPIEGEPGAATIWLLSTPVIYDYPVEFVISSKRIFDDAHQRFELLTNFVDERKRFRDHLCVGA